MGLNPLSNQGHSIPPKEWMKYFQKVCLNPLSNQGHSIPEDITGKDVIGVLVLIPLVIRVIQS